MAKKTKARAGTTATGRPPTGAKTPNNSGKRTTITQRLRAKRPPPKPTHGIEPDPTITSDGWRGTITVYPSRYATGEGRGLPVCWGQILDMLASPLSIPDGGKDALPFWHGSRLKPGGRRRNADVTAVSILFLDIDERLDDVLDAIEARGILAVAFPSPSGKEDRGRVLIPLSRDVTPAEFRVLWAVVNGWTGGLVDPQTKSPSHGYYQPAIGDPDAWWVDVFEGEILDVDAIDLSHDDEEAEPVMRAPTTDELVTFDLPWRRRQVEEAISSIPDATEGARHGSLFRVAQTCLDYAIPEDEIEALVLEWNDDRCKPPKDHDVVRACVLANLERYRRHPVGCAVTLCARSSRNHSETLDRVLSILAERCSGLYARKGTLTEIVSEEGGDRMEPVSVKRLNELVTRHVRLFTYKEATTKAASGWYRTDVPKWVSEEIDARPSYPQLRELEGIANAATLRTDGTVLCEPGYDPATRLVYTGEPVDVPERPTRDEGLAALERVESLFSQFPLDDAGRAAHMALMLTAVARTYLRGPVPIGLFDASARQSGKSILAQSISVIMIGRRAAKVDWIANDEKMADRLHACAATDGRIVLFDNVRNGAVLDSPMLDGALTTMAVSRPKKYAHVNMDLAFRPVVLITGNAMRVGGDLPSRCLFTRLDSPLERPEERDDLAIPELLDHLEENRQTVIADLLTAWRAGLEADLPGVPPWLTFPGWMPVRKLLVWYGRSDPAETRKVAREHDENEELGRLVLSYIEEHWPDGVSSSDIADRLRPRKSYVKVGEEAPRDEDAATIWSWIRSHEQNKSGAEPDARLVGVVLGTITQVFDGRRLRQERPRIDGKKRKRWIVRPIEAG